MSALFTACRRCGKELARSREPNPEAKLLRLASDETIERGDGVCANCALTRFLKDTEPISTILATRGPDLLLNDGVAELAGRLLITAKSDADLSEIDWHAVVGNWSIA